MYIEASFSQPGAQADLVSTLLAPGHTYCMEIALNMYGNKMGQINVYVMVFNKTCLYLLIFFISYLEWHRFMQICIITYFCSRNSQIGFR